MLTGVHYMPLSLSTFDLLSCTLHLVFTIPSGAHLQLCARLSPTPAVVGAPPRAAMKKVSTGERIRFADLRRRSVGGPRGDADSDVMSEQLFVSELMDTTPSSSYEGETVRDVFVYNPRDASVSDSPLARYDSDGEAADEVVTGTQEGVGKADLIVKEDVPEVRRALPLMRCGPLMPFNLRTHKCVPVSST